MLFVSEYPAMLEGGKLTLLLASLTGLQGYVTSQAAWGSHPVLETGQPGQHCLTGLLLVLQPKLAKELKHLAGWLGISAKLAAFLHLVPG